MLELGYRYWDNYYYTPTQPKKVRDGIKAKSKRGAIGETWWSKRWIAVLESFHMGARLGRGRRYARLGQVAAINIKSGIVTAKVQGTRSKPYSITIRLTPLSKSDWDKVTDAMAAQAIFAAKLLGGEMPNNIEEAFDEVNISLFPTSKRDLKTDCSCPDWANPCKHIAAVYYLLAERFDDDPFLIFKLRGRTKDKLMAKLKEKRVDKLATQYDSTTTSGKQLPVQEFNILPEKEYIQRFWDAGEELDSFALDPKPATVDKAVLKRLGTAPGSIPGKNINILLSKFYEVASSAALQKASYDTVNELGMIQSKDDIKTVQRRN